VLAVLATLALASIAIVLFLLRDDFAEHRWLAALASDDRDAVESAARALVASGNIGAIPALVRAARGDVVLQRWLDRSFASGGRVDAGKWRSSHGGRALWATDIVRERSDARDEARRALEIALREAHEDASLESLVVVLDALDALETFDFVRPCFADSDAVGPPSTMRAP